MSDDERHPDATVDENELDEERHDRDETGVDEDDMDENGPEETGIDENGPEETGIDENGPEETGMGENETEEIGMDENVGQRFDRLPETPAERRVKGRISREELLSYFEDRFGIPHETFEDHTVWEKGAGKIWIYAGEAPSPTKLEALGMTCLRTRQEHPKPTTDFVQRFGREASDCVIELSRGEAERFVSGEDQELEWDGDWGYLIAAHEVAGQLEPLGVGLYLHGELQSMVPKGRQRDVR